MKRILTGAGIFVVLVGLFVSRLLADAVYFNIVLFLLLFVGTQEFAGAFGARLTKPARAVLFVYSALFFLPYYFAGGMTAVWYYVIGAVVVSHIVHLFDKNASAESIAAANTCLLYPAPLFMCAVVLNGRADGFYALLLLFASVCLADIAAYAFGVTLGKGKKKIAPEISPNKTYVGFFGGLFGGLLGAAAVYGAYRAELFDAPPLFADAGGLTLLHYLIAGLFIALFTFAGDLTASLYKRKTGIKDYGKIFPGHGGVLDRFDGNIFASVFLLIYLSVFF